MTRSVVIIGAGISGLAAAVTLKRRGFRVRVLEGAGHAGGVIQSRREEGFLCEMGPNTLMVSREETMEALKGSGLWDSAMDASPHSKKRYVLRDGKPVPIPMGPGAFFSTPLLSWKGKWRVLREPFIPAGKIPNESVGDWVHRRFGPEIANEMMDPLISGIYGGSMNELVLRHVFPKMAELESQHGSIIRGLMRSGKKKMARRMVSWENGLHGLVGAWEKELGDSLSLNSRVLTLSRWGERFMLRTEREEVDADRVVLAADLKNMAKLLSSLHKKALVFDRSPMASMAVLHLGFKREHVGHPLDGFGMLISRARGVRVLGSLFSSSLFPGRAPEGCVLLTVFAGGRHDSGMLDLSDVGLKGIALKELTPVLEIKRAPIFEKITRWQNVIPQYTVIHDDLLNACKEIETEIPGLHLLGNYRDGVSVEDCMNNGISLGGKI